MIVVLLSALLTLAGQPVNVPEEENSTFSDRQPVRLAPIPAQRALGAFRDICMAGFPDPAAFDQAAGASDLGFVRTENGRRGASEWTSTHGQIVLRNAPNWERETRRDRREGHASRVRWTSRCDFWVAIEERVTASELVAAIGAQLAPQTRPVEEILGVSWPLESPEAGTTLSLVYLPSNDDDRIFTLSLQRLSQAAPR